MIITLLFLFVLIVGIVLFVKNKGNYSSNLDCFGLAISILAGCGFIVCCLVILLSQVNPEYCYQQDMIEYETLVYEDANDYITFGNDVATYNKKVNGYKTWANNPWTNWFYYDGCENVPFYELDKKV